MSRKKEPMVEAPGAMSREPMVGALVPRQEKVPWQSEVEGASTPDSCPDNLDSGAILEELVTMEVPGGATGGGDAGG
jgi:hypothetical protein